MQYPNQYIESCLEGPSSLFKTLTQRDKEAISQHHTLLEARKGALLAREGEKARGLICLASGKVKVFKEGVGGREQIIKMIRQNGLFGYKALFNESSWSFSAGAIEESKACLLEKNTMIKILRKNPELTLKLTRIMAEELVFTSNRILSLTQKHVRGRIAESLIVLRDVYGFEDDGRTIRVSISREDLANLSNMTTSNAIRTLSAMASEAIIGLNGRKISILDNQNLEHICSMG
jgi:CRP/FNR family transcriptional regulator, polysaccharide utilization system transcription regulator